MDVPNGDCQRYDGMGYDATASTLSGRPAPPDRPPSEMVEPARTHRAAEQQEGSEAQRDPMTVALAGRTGGWTSTGDGDWRLESTDGTEQAIVRTVGTDYEARVFRHRTGAKSPDPLLAHGPQVFHSAEEALQYCESNVAPRPTEV